MQCLCQYHVALQHSKSQTGLKLEGENCFLFCVELFYDNMEICFYILVLCFTVVSFR